MTELSVLCVGQAEFEQQLAASEKAQMMAKLNMLLTTRGESIDTIKLVAAQTELEVEVQATLVQAHALCRRAPRPAAGPPLYRVDAPLREDKKGTAGARAAPPTHSPARSCTTWWV